MNVNEQLDWDWKRQNEVKTFELLTFIVILTIIRFQFKKCNKLNESWFELQLQFKETISSTRLISSTTRRKSISSRSSTRQTSLEFLASRLNVEDESHDKLRRRLNLRDLWHYLEDSWDILLISSKLAQTHILTINMGNI